MDPENEIENDNRAVNDTQEQPAPVAEANEQPAASEVQPVAQEAPKAAANAPKWAMDRINEETNRRREEQQAREAAENEARNLKEMLTRLQNGGKPAEQTNQPARQPAPTVDPTRYQADVRAEAERQRLYADSAVVRATGAAAFPNFNDSLNILSAVGATTDDFVADIFAATDRANAHVMIDTLAKDPEKAAGLAKMDSRSRIAELTRIAMVDQIQKAASAAPAPVAKPAPVTKAPAPPPRVDPAGGATTPNLMDDNLSDEEWFNLYRNQRKIA